MSVKSLLSSGLQRMESYLDTPKIYFRNGKYPCVPSTERRGTVLERGGKMMEVTLTVHVRKDAIPSPVTAEDENVSVEWDAPDVLEAGANTPISETPRSGRRAGRNKVLYRIISVHDSAPGSHWVLDLADAKR